jgi:peptidoglycan-N-acetylglucosamine deacetylase
MIWSAVILLLVLVAGLDLMGFFVWYACSVPHSQVLGPTLVRGPAVGQRIAITFDDGPQSPYTEQILDILRDRKVRATFFVCGKNAERHPEILRRIAAEGHLLGNHTFSHPYLYFLNRATMANEIDQAQETIAKLTGHRPKLFRPPYGGRWFGLFPLLRERGMDLVQWSDGGEDWKSFPGATVRATLRRLGSGSIILLHDGQQASGGYLDGVVRGFAYTRALRSQPTVADSLANNQSPPSTVLPDIMITIRALPEIIDGARRLGLEFVPLEEFLSKP